MQMVQKHPKRPPQNAGMRAGKAKKQNKLEKRVVQRKTIWVISGAPEGIVVLDK